MSHDETASVGKEDDLDLSWLAGSESDTDLLSFDATPPVEAAVKPSPVRPGAPPAVDPGEDNEFDRLMEEILASGELDQILPPPSKRQRLSKRLTPKTRTMRSITPDKDYGWNPEGTMFRGCVGVQMGGEPKYENWTKDEVKERMNTMIRTKWKWTGAETERSRCNLSRWLLKVKDTYGADKFNPRDVEIFKLDHKKGKGSRKNSVPGTAKYYPPYDALCCGYEVSRCPFMVTDDPSHTKMRLSPVFVECLKANRLL